MTNTDKLYVNTPLNVEEFLKLFVKAIDSEAANDVGFTAWQEAGASTKLTGMSGSPIESEDRQYAIEDFGISPTIHVGFYNEDINIVESRDEVFTAVLSLIHETEWDLVLFHTSPILLRRSGDLLLTAGSYYRDRLDEINIPYILKDNLYLASN
jgi:hypothetical protein